MLHRRYPTGITSSTGGIIPPTDRTPAEKALISAIENRDLKAFGKAVAAGTDPMALRARDGRSMLEMAMESRADDIAFQLLDQGAELAGDSRSLFWAMMVRRPDLVQRTLELGADPNMKTGMGCPLNIAASEPNMMLKGSDEDLLRIMQMLIDAGGDIESQSAMGSPLKDAVRRNRMPGAKFLIDAGAKIDLKELVELANINENAEMATLLQTAAKTKRKPAKTKAKPAASDDPIIADLESACGSKAFPFAKIPGAVSLHVDSKAKLNLEKLQASFLKRGVFVFATDHKSTSVAMLRTADKYDVIATMCTNGNNHGLGNEAIIEWLRELEKTHPFVLTGIGFDFLQGKFAIKPKKPAELAERMYEFCPDIVDQGLETVEALEEMLRKKRDFFFWWD